VSIAVGWCWSNDELKIEPITCHEARSGVLNSKDLRLVNVRSRTTLWTSVRPSVVGCDGV